MIVWKQDETGFVLFERITCFYIKEMETNDYRIYADDIYMGKVEKEVDAKRILAKISANYKTYQNECNPW